MLDFIWVWDWHVTRLWFLLSINSEYSLEGLKLAEAPILWPPDAKSWLRSALGLTWVSLGKDPDPGKDWRWEEKGTTEEEMVGWHHWLNGHEFEQALEDGEGQGGLMCCSPWSHKESDTTERLDSSSIWAPRVHPRPRQALDSLSVLLSPSITVSLCLLQRRLGGPA